jgi:tetratricopeptide (TPR) repeat protein
MLEKDEGEQMKLTNSKLVVSVLACCMMLVLTAFGQAPQSDEVRVLPPSQTIEREMTGAETHRYKFDLQANEFFQVRVEQKGVDVALKLMDTGGKVLAMMDSPNENQGPETLSFVVRQAGSFVLDVSRFDLKAEKGNYSIRREAPRTATAKDMRRVDVERLFVEGMTARDTEGQLEIAIQKMSQAQAGWEELADSYMVGLTAQQVNQLRSSKAKVVFDEAMGLFNQRTAEAYRAALAKFQEASQLYREAGDQSREMQSLVRAGSISENLGEKTNALMFYETALEFFRTVADKYWEAVTLNNIAVVYSALGEQQKALEYLKRSLSLRRAIGDRSSEALTLNNIGFLYFVLGEQQTALAYYNQALPLFRALGDRGSEAATLNNIGQVYWALGEQQKALEFYNQTLPIFKTVGNRSMEATTLDNIANVYSVLGERQTALTYYNQALLLFKAAGGRSGEAITLNNIATVYDDLDEKQKAIEYYNQVLPILKAVGDRYREATALNNIGKVYSDLGEQQKALEFYNQALSLHRVVGDRDGEATTLVNIGNVYSVLGEQRKALEYFNQALPLLKAVSDRRGEAITLGNVMLTWEALNNRRMAIFYGKQSVNKYQELRQAIQGLDNETQKSFLHTVRYPYRELAEVLIEDRQLAQAVQVLNLYQDQQFFDFDRNPNEPVKQVALSPREAALAARYEQASEKVGQVGGQIEELKRHISNRQPDEQEVTQRTQLEASFKTASATLLAVPNNAEAEFSKPRGEQDTVLTASDVTDLQTTLRELIVATKQESVALYTLVGEKHFRVLLVTPDGIKPFATPINGDEFNQRLCSSTASCNRRKKTPARSARGSTTLSSAPSQTNLRRRARRHCFGPWTATCATCR